MSFPARWRDRRCLENSSNRPLVCRRSESSQGLHFLCRYVLTEFTCVGQLSCTEFTWTYKNGSATLGLQIPSEKVFGVLGLLGSSSSRCDDVTGGTCFWWSSSLQPAWLPEKAINMRHIKMHYFTSHPDLNKFAVIPKGREIDYSAPHKRARLSK